MQLCLWRMRVQPIWVSTRIIHLYPNIQTMFGRLPSPSPHFQSEVGWGHYNLPKTNESPGVYVYITAWNPTTINVCRPRKIFMMWSILLLHFKKFSSSPTLKLKGVWSQWRWVSQVKLYIYLLLVHFSSWFIDGKACSKRAALDAFHRM